MSQIFDLIAKISWDTNQDALKGINSDLRNQDKLLEELRAKGSRLNEQLIKTNDPKKVKSINDELQKTKKAVDSIIDGQKKQATSIDNLNKKQKELIANLQKTNDPKMVQGLLRNLRQVENQLSALDKQTTSLPSKLGGFGQSLLQGLGMGAGMFGLQQGLQLISDSIAEFEDAQKTALDLQRALKVIGKDKYFDGLKSEADSLAVKFHGLFDNDDIIKAQTALVQYGKVSREEISKLMPVIMNLASAEGIDLLSATEKIVNIMEGRGGQTLRDYGVSVKGVKTEHDRLNIVLGDFQKKLEGAADTYATTAQGIEQTNMVMIKNIEERFGESFSKIKMLGMHMITPLLESFTSFLDKNDKYAELNRQRNGVFPASSNQLKGWDPTNPKNWPGALDTTTPMNPNATLVDPEAEAKAKEAAKKAEDVRKKRLEEQKHLNEELIKLRNELEAVSKGKDEQELNNINEKYRQLLNKVKEFNLEEYDLEVLHQNELLNKKHEFAKRDLSILTDLHVQKEVEVKKDQKKEIESLEAYGKRVLATLLAQAELQENALAKKGKDKIKRRQGQGILMSEVNSLGSSITSIYDIEIAAINDLVSAQEKRVESAKTSSDMSLKIEQNRLDELVKKRERYEKQQSIINNSVIIANQALAISNILTGFSATVKSGNAYLIAADVVAVLAAIATGYAAVRSMSNQSKGFEEGGYTGDGGKSDVAGHVHKGEFVMTKDITTKNRDLLEDMHKGKLIVNRMNDGYYLTHKSIDVDKAVSDHYSVQSNLNMRGVESVLQSIDEKLSRRDVNVKNVFDSNGIVTVVTTELGRNNLLNKMRN